MRFLLKGCQFFARQSDCMRYERDISMQKGKYEFPFEASQSLLSQKFYEHKFKINWTRIDSWWSRTRGKIVSQWICDHDYNWHIERKWSRIYKTLWTIDSWRLDSNCNGIFTTVIVNFYDFYLIATLLSISFKCIYMNNFYIFL